MSIRPDLERAAAAAIQSSESGDFAPVVWLLAQGMPPDWGLALRALLWHADPAAGRLPDPKVVHELSLDANWSPGALARACLEAERACIRALDRSALGSWLALHQKLVGRMVSHDLRWLQVMRLWANAMDGADAEWDERAKTALSEAAADGQSSLVVEITCLRSLAALAQRDSDAAIKLARRASRMAQVEGLPHWQCLSSLVLSRVRRHLGKPHLARHVLVPLAKAAPASLAAWIRWELLLAGGHGVEPNDDAQSPAARAAAALEALLACAVRGDRQEFGCALATARTCVAGCRDAARELEVLVGAITLREEACPDIIPFRRGDTDRLPAGIHGTCAPDSDDESAFAYVVADPLQPAARILRLGLPLAGVQVTPGERCGRTDAALAVLALAGLEGLPKERFFHSVFGFPFVPGLHTGVLDVLLHRVRDKLGARGELTRCGQHLQLTVRERFVVADARCVQPFAERLLYAIAGKGAVTAADTAARLTVPLRTVQAALKQLVADGACRMDRQGRRVVYELEDTMFTRTTGLGVAR